MTLNTVARLHLTELKRTLNPATVRQRRYILEAFLAFVGGDVEVRAVKRKVVEDWLFSQEIAASTLRVRHNVVRALFRFAYDRGWTTKSPALGIKLPRIPKKQPRTLTADDFRALDRVMPDERSRVIVALALNEGLRRVEIARLELSDIDTLNMTVRVQTAKSGSEDLIPLTRFTFYRLKSYMTVRGNVPGPLIQSQRGHGGITADAIGNMVAKWMKEAGIKVAAFDGKSLHACRHTCAMNLLEHGADPQVIQLALRHSTLSSTWTYLRAARSVEELRPWMGLDIREVS